MGAFKRNVRADAAPIAVPKKPMADQYLMEQRRLRRVRRKGCRTAALLGTHNVLKQRPN